MTTIYVVMEGKYSDYRAISVWSTEEKANTCAGAAAERSVLPFELDKPDQHPGMRFYRLYMLKDGSVVEIHRASAIYNDKPQDYLCVKSVKRKPGIPFRLEAMLDCTCWATDERHAIKIANEKRIQRISSGRWIT